MSLAKAKNRQQLRIQQISYPLSASHKTKPARSDQWPAAQCMPPQRSPEKRILGALMSFNLRLENRFMTFTNTPKLFIIQLFLKSDTSRLFIWAATSS